jgi:hypothetical protein
MAALKTKIDPVLDQNLNDQNGDLVFDKICSICESIFDSDKKDDNSCKCSRYGDGSHIHVLLKDLIVRSREGCKLCSLILNSYKPVLRKRLPILSPLQHFEDDGTHGFEHIEYGIFLKDALGDDSPDQKASVDHRKMLLLRALPRIYDDKRHVRSPRFTRKYRILITPIVRI